MKKWTEVDKTVAGGRTISLHEHDGNYTIRVDGVALMSTRQHASEEEIAVLACSPLVRKRQARVLIGGLGFGFTLKASLSVLAPDATVVVAEILAAVIAWNRGATLKVATNSLADPRVILLHQDVREVIRGAEGGFDSIILDVDNGPAGLTADGNNQLYSLAGLRFAREALRPKGCLAIWSAFPAPAFAELMARTGFKVEVKSSRSHSDSGKRHTLFLGRN